MAFCPLALIPWVSHFTSEPQFTHPYNQILMRVRVGLPTLQDCFFKNQMKSCIHEKILGKLYSMSKDSYVKCMSYMSLQVNYHHFF